jgi:predicted PolB exonuclease-like 3'-5' exonuclease
MNNEIVKLFDEILKKYEEAEKKNLEYILNFGLISYQRQIEGLKKEVKEYKAKLNDLLK